MSSSALSPASTTPAEHVTARATQAQSLLQAYFTTAIKPEAFIDGAKHLLIQGEPHGVFGPTPVEGASPVEEGVLFALTVVYCDALDQHRDKEAERDEEMIRVYALGFNILNRSPQVRAQTVAAFKPPLLLSKIIQDTTMQFTKACCSYCKATRRHVPKVVRGALEAMASFKERARLSQLMLDLAPQAQASVEPALAEALPGILKDAEEVLTLAKGK